MSVGENVAYAVPKLTDYSPEALEKASRELISALEAESDVINTEADWKTFRDRWMARKNGILTTVNDLWLKKAPAASKRDVGQRVNQLKVRVEETVEATLERIQGGASTARVESD